MVAVCHIAVARGLIEASAAERVGGILAALSLPVSFAELPAAPSACRDADRLGEIMSRDKKARGGIVRFVLPTNLGTVGIFDDVTSDLVAAAIAALGP